ncbi:transposase [Streptomyces sp. TLI_105]|uniref:transposase n=1 Tax=Streptomyces sp. TLI_105 TaxID=1881019 RepID=UPI000895E6BD|nr:Transposase DDE domain-containing protein [Streptomyces sp. TLI_105]
MVLADEAYSSRAIRRHLREPTSSRSSRFRPAGALTACVEGPGGRPPAFDREAYKQRNTVERYVNRLKQWCGIATRWEKTAPLYLAGLHVAALFLWSARPTAQDQEQERTASSQAPGLR